MIIINTIAYNYHQTNQHTEYKHISTYKP